jgi:hypothetical protein
MIARLILVGMVGVLGVSLPDGAGWATRSSGTRTEAVASAGTRLAVPFEPIAVEDNPMNQIADELNRASEVPDIPVAPIAPVAAIRPTVATASDEELDRLFAENQVWSEPVTAPDVAPVPEHRPSFEPIALVADAPSIADELNRVSEVVDIDPTTATIPTPRGPAFEPIAVAEGESGIADELNRCSDGLSTPEAAEPPSLKNALSLTRDAALAWMNVLTKTMNAPGRSG